MTMINVKSLLWPALVALAVSIYMLGVDGPFLFDDYANLNALGAHGGVDDWQSLWLYLSEAHSGPTGRPISLISFLINDNNWPSSPASFKYTNILLHVLNACLLFWLQIRLLRVTQRFTEAQCLFIAIIGSGTWLFHPMFVSTTLYVVQRMAMLAATFVLLGLLSYVISREHLGKNTIGAYLGMSFSLLFFGILAVLSKENGALLPVLALVIESTVFADQKNIRKRWTGPFLLLPTTAIFIYLIYVAVSSGFLSDWPTRSFSPAERLMTEARIIWDYLFHLYSLRGKAGGIFFENYDVSESLFDPVYTFPSIVSLLLLLVCAFTWRKRFILFSLPVLFFLAGHLIESTTVGLELYFDHRNYLPSAFLFLPLGASLYKLPYSARNILAAFYISLIASLLFFKVEVWSDRLNLAIDWIEGAPYSVRAQRSAAIALTAEGHAHTALDVLNKAQDRFPQSHALLIHRIVLKCSLSLDVKRDKAQLTRISREVEFEPKLSMLLDSFISVALSGKCPQIDIAYMLDFIGALSQNPKALKSEGFRHQVHYFTGVLRSRGNDPKKAVEEFSRALDLRPRLGTALRVSAVLATEGHCEEATKFVGRSEQILEHNISSFDRLKIDYYKKEIETLRRNIIENCKDVRGS